jgi:hypothetical protein
MGIVRARAHGDRNRLQSPYHGAYIRTDVTTECDLTMPDSAAASPIRGKNVPICPAT